MLRFIIWMIIVFIAGKILGVAIRSLRRLLTPNRDVLTKRPRSPFARRTVVEDIPYEEVKDPR
ncbi:MAG: hypothetical protein HUU02_08095 [Bacteroidetes bacterium]|nr:hypothetical protein [Bacteroidota bacterium]